MIIVVVFFFKYYAQDSSLFYLSLFHYVNLFFIYISILLNISIFISFFIQIFFHILIYVFILVPHYRKPFILGLHFFTPAHIMKLVEVVMCVSTSVQAAQAVMTVSKKLGKTGVLVRGLKSVFLRRNTFFGFFFDIL